MVTYIFGGCVTMPSNGLIEFTKRRTKTDKKLFVERNIQEVLSEKQANKIS